MRYVPGRKWSETYLFIKLYYLVCWITFLLPCSTHWSYHKSIFEKLWLDYFSFIENKLKKTRHTCNKNTKNQKISNITKNKHEIKITILVLLRYSATLENIPLSPQIRIDLIWLTIEKMMSYMILVTTNSLGKDSVVSCLHGDSLRSPEIGIERLKQ